MHKIHFPTEALHTGELSTLQWGPQLQSFTGTTSVTVRTGLYLLALSLPLGDPSVCPTEIHKCHFLVGMFWSDIDRSEANHKNFTTEKLSLATGVTAGQQIGITMHYHREGQKLCICLQRAHKGLGTVCATARRWRWWQPRWHQECRNWPKLTLLSDPTGRMGSPVSAPWEQVSAGWSF